ncbi:MAG: universal stress protein [Saprospiraceae bacterium]|jgi:nucleotide-binding universal stress UspA family protein
MRTQVLKKKNGVRKSPGFSVKHLLAALELGSADDTVLRYLDFLTAAVPVKNIRLLHVLPTFELFQSPVNREAAAVMGHLKLNKTIVAEMQRRIALHPMSQHSEIAIDIREGKPLQALLEEAAHFRSDLTVIGQRAEAGEHGILAANLARKAKGNILIVPEQARAEIRHIIVPVDFSPYSVKALKLAMGLRKTIKGPVRITCMNVFELPNLNIYLVEKIEDVRKIVREDRLAAFRLFLGQFAHEDIKDIHTEVIERQFGGIAGYIREFAEKVSGDLIILGAKGHSNVERLLLGSVAERLMGLNDNIPVLLVR